RCAAGTRDTDGEDHPPTVRAGGGQNGRDAVTCDEIEELAGALALGAALPEEVAAARTHLATCATGHPAVHELAATAALLAEAAEPVEPPARLRERILAAARADLGSAGGSPVATLDAPRPPRQVTSRPSSSPAVTPEGT